MEYPGAKFTRSLRLAMLFLFIVAFFTISPTVILYSAGYRYDFKNGLLREVGSLSVDVLPQTASVYLDGLKLKDKMPIRLNNISPHKYSLKLTAPGYFDWEKQIEIKKNQTTYIKDIVMIKKNKPELITKGKIGQVLVSNTGRFLAYTLINQNTSLIIHDTELDKANNALKLDTIEPITLEWAPQTDFLAVSSDKGPFNKITIVNAAQNSNISLSDRNGTISKFIWKKTDETEIFYRTENGIESYLPGIEQVRSITKNPNFDDWHLDNGALWTLNINTNTKKLDIHEDTLGFNRHFTSTAPENTHTEDLYDWKLLSIGRGTVLLKNDKLGKFMIVRQDRTYLVNGNNYYISKFNDWWVMWSPWELWTYSQGEEPFLLNRSGNKIYNVRSLDQFNTLALQWENNVSALHPYYYIEQTIIDKQITEMDVNPNTRTIYFTNSSGLWKLVY